MKRFITSLTVAVGIAGVAGLHAQDVKSKTTVSAEHSKTVTYTGCVENGSSPTAYIFTHAMPVGQSSQTVTGTSGTTTTTTTTYALVPGTNVALTEHVGHKVQVTGVMMSGDIKTKTKTEVEHGGTSVDKSKVDDAMPQFRVTSVKHLADSCVM